MAFIQSEKIQDMVNIDVSSSIVDEFSIRTILTNQQSLIIEMQEKMDFIIPKLENEMIAIKQENKALVEKSIAQEMEIRKIKQKNYQTHKYAESNHAMIMSKLRDIEIELQRLDSAYEVLKIQIELNKQSGLRTSSYKAYSQRLKM